MRIVIGIFALLFSAYAFAMIPVYTEEKLGISVDASHAVFTVKLKSNPSTGYAWFLRDYDARLIDPIKHLYEAPVKKKLIGAPGYELWTFRAKPEAFIVPRQSIIRFVYARPWEGGNEQANQVVFRISTHKLH